MEKRARKVQAERNRRRLPRRGRAARWARRLTGLIATAVFIGVGVAIALMVMPDPRHEQAAVASTPTPTATATPRKPAKKPPAKPKGPTKAEREALQAALATVRSQGYTTLSQRSYDAKARLRVLIGRPVGDAAGGYRAFFFVKDQFIGNDTTSPSTKLTVARTGKEAVTLTYGVFAPGDTAGAPSGRERVRFRLEGATLQPLDPIPPAAVRFQRRGG